MKSPRFFMSCTLLIFVLHSCASLAPKYHRPVTEIPCDWRIPTDSSSTIDNTYWWENLQDPVLNALIDEALENNKDLGLAVSRVYEFKARYGIVSSALYPQLNGQVNASRQRISQTAGFLGGFNGNGGGNTIAPLFPLQFSPFNTNYLGVMNVAYELDIWGKIRNASAASYDELLAQIEVRRTVVLTLVSQVASSYILLRQYDEQLKIAKRTLESRIQSLKLAEVRFKEGLTSELEVKQAAAEVDEAQIRVILFETQIPQQENLISVLVGHPPRSLERGKNIFEWSEPAEIPAGLPSEILEQRPDILQAEYLLMAANAKVGEARALLFPDLTLTGYAGTQSSQLHQLFTDPSKVWQIAGNLLQPIFEGGRILNTIALANSVKREAYYNYQQTILTAFKEVDDALIAHAQSKIAVKVEELRVEDLKQYLHLATLQYENGLVDYLNVLDAERRLFDAQLDLAQSQALVFLTLVNVYKSLGGGWVIEADNQVICSPLARSI